VRACVRVCVCVCASGDNNMKDANSNTYDNGWSKSQMKEQFFSSRYFAEIQKTASDWPRKTAEEVDLIPLASYQVEADDGRIDQ